MMANKDAGTGGDGLGRAMKSAGASNPITWVGLWAAFTIWVAIATMLGFLGCVIVPLLLGANTLTENRLSIAPRLSTRSLPDRIAWVTFTIGVWSMLWTALRALVGESDGDFRSWDEIRRQVRILLAGGCLAIGVPAVVAVLQYAGRLNAIRVARASGLPESRASSLTLERPDE
jgi:hypothetical protein